MQSVRERPSDPWIGMIGWVGCWDLVLNSDCGLWIVDGWWVIEATWRGSDRRTEANETSGRRQPAANVPFSFLCLLTTVLGLQRCTF